MVCVYGLVFWERWSPLGRADTYVWFGLCFLMTLMMIGTAALSDYYYIIDYDYCFDNGLWIIIIIIAKMQMPN